MGEGLVSGPFHEAELAGNTPSSIKFSGWGSKISQNKMSEHWSTQRKEASTNTFFLPFSLQDLVFQTQWEFWTGLAIRPRKKWAGKSVHRQVITPEPEHGMVSIRGADGLFYANTVGTIGVVSAGQNWGRLAIAPHRWALKLVDAQEVLILLFSDDAHSISEGGISEGSFFSNNVS